MSDSFIGTHNGQVTSFVGMDAVQLYRAAATKTAIKLHRDTGILTTRGATISKLFKIAGEYTGKAYKRGEHAKAMADLDVWINTMKSALPIVER